MPSSVLPRDAAARAPHGPRHTCGARTTASTCHGWLKGAEMRSLHCSVETTAFDVEALLEDAVEHVVESEHETCGSLA